MEKRKIIFGTYDTAVDGLWTLAAWSLSSAQHVTNYVAVPGRDGSLDLSTAITDGEPRYNDRTLTATFESSEGDRLEREGRINVMTNWLDGWRMNIELPDDPDHYITGRLHIQKDYNDPAHAAVTVTAAYQTTLNGKTYTGSSFTSDLLTKSGSISLVTKVKDSRGRWSEAKTTTVQVLAYSPPKIQALSAWRVDENGEAKEDGIYAAVAYRYSVTSLGSKNTAAMKIEYKRSTLENWATLISGSALSANTTALPIEPTFSTDYQWDIRITVTDWFKASATYQASLPSGAVVLDILADGTGLKIGGVCELPGFDLGWNLSEQALSFSSQAGQLRLGGLLIQWGGVSITPSAAGTPTTALVTFPIAYSATPTVFVTPVSSVPQTLSVAVQRAADVVGDPKAKVAVTLTRDGTTTTGINWLAIGPA